MENIDLDQLKKLEVPNLRSTIYNCNLHQTTKIEAYRKRAIDSFGDYERLVQEFYPIVLKKLEEHNNNHTMEEIVEELNNLADMKEANEWKDYCLRCEKPILETCSQKREELIAFQEAKREGANNLIKCITEAKGFSSTDSSRSIQSRC